MSNEEREKRHLMRKFLLIVFSIVFLYITVIAGFIAYTYMNDDESDDYFDNNDSVIPSIFNFKIPDKTNFVLLGLDESKTRTDTIMAGCYDNVNKKITLISIPRDTLVEIPEGRFRIMKEQGTATIDEMRINSVYHHSPEGYKTEFAVKQIGELLGVDMDYYAVVDFEAFRYIIDSIGGVEYNVEQRLYYVDPTQDLYIDLQPGLQLLDGEAAEGLVRYRSGYARADLHRIEVQQDFMKVLIKTLLSKENIVSNPTAYITTAIKYLDTNISISDCAKYVSALKDISAATIDTCTLPGTTQTLSGASYYITDEDELTMLADEVFLSTGKEEFQYEDSFDKDIQILNGGYTSGLARDKMEYLEEKGYKVINISDYSGSKTNNTRIFVKDKAYGSDLMEYFSDSEIIVDKNQDYDIIIVLGTDES